MGKASVSVMSAMIGDLLEFTRTRLRLGRGYGTRPANPRRSARSDQRIARLLTRLSRRIGRQARRHLRHARIRLVVSNYLCGPQWKARHRPLSRGGRWHAAAGGHHEGVPLSPKRAGDLRTNAGSSGWVGAQFPQEPGLGLSSRGNAIAHGATSRLRPPRERHDVRVELHCSNPPPGSRPPGEG